MNKLSQSKFYAILDTGYVAETQFYDKCVALLAGGADIIQLRAKKESHDARVKLLEIILPLFEKTDVPLIINDDLDLCMKYPGLGLHVGQDDLPVEEARERLGTDCVLGLSTHSVEQAEGAIAKTALLDYFAVGPVFATQTKPDYTPVGMELVKKVSELQASIPFFAIGGISRKTVSDVCDAGASRVVSVSDVLCDEDTEGAVKELRALVPNVSF